MKYVGFLTVNVVALVVALTTTEEKTVSLTASVLTFKEQDFSSSAMYGADSSIV